MSKIWFIPLEMNHPSTKKNYLLDSFSFLENNYQLIGSDTLNMFVNEQTTEWKLWGRLQAVQMLPGPKRNLCVSEIVWHVAGSADRHQDQKQETDWRCHVCTQIHTLRSYVFSIVLQFVNKSQDCLYILLQTFTQIVKHTRSTRHHSLLLMWQRCIWLDTRADVIVLSCFRLRHHDSVRQCCY